MIDEHTRTGICKLLHQNDFDGARRLAQHYDMDVMKVDVDPEAIEYFLVDDRPHLDLTDRLHVQWKNDLRPN
jgi:hypothetical protein